MKRYRARRVALKVAWAFIGKWYKWGGDDPAGFDCSGLAIEILKSVGLFPRKSDTTALGLYRKFRDVSVDDPGLGVLAFYFDSDGDIGHVEFCIDRHRTIGASGGGPWVTSANEAIKSNAFIKVRPIARAGRAPFFVDPYRRL